jgi:hypothetical protein
MISTTKLLIFTLFTGVISSTVSRKNWSADTNPFVVNFGGVGLAMVKSSPPAT